MKNVTETGAKVLKAMQIHSIFLLFIIILLSYGISQAVSIKLASLTPKDQDYIVRSETIRVVTAYNAGDPRQTDDTPCIAANGENICKALAKGKKRCAANFVPLGSHLHVDKVGVCLVTDRTNKRYRNRVDIAMQKNEYHKARQFGRQKLIVKVIDITNVSHQNAKNR
jgi:3D (Asp-Asp-Asp) domain-containing protein